MVSSMKASNASNFKDSDTDFFREKIAIAAREITYPNDRMTFIKQMISMSKLLMMYDLHISTAYKEIDEKAQDPTYFVAAYFDTNDIEQALWVHRMVRLLTRYILLYDKFFELGENTYKLLARKVLRAINELIANSKDNEHLKYSIDFSLKQFWIFWNFENMVKRRILEGHTISYKEIRHFNLLKSSDASIVYAKVLDATIPSFNENISLVLHYNQALLDLLDDWQDIEEDVREDMPNVFVMASLGIVPYNKIKNSNPASVRSVILDALRSSSISVTRIVNEYQTSVKNISIPDKLGFLKIISDYHADRLRKAILQKSNSK